MTTHGLTNRIDLRIFISCLAIAFALGTPEQWTEEDETRRLLQLKQEEMRLFELQMRGQGTYPSALNYNTRYGSTNTKYGSYGSSSNEQSYPAFGGSGGGYRDVYRHAEPAAIHAQPKVALDTPRSDNPLSVSARTLPFVRRQRNENWCFYCTSPLSSVSDNMQQVIKNLLEVRRAEFPKDVITDSCTDPKDVKTLPKQSCLHSHCQTLILTDHDTASAFTLRGCAETFGAVNEAALEKRGDNVCRKLHGSVDIQECICKHRKYCYAGSDRDIDTGSDEFFDEELHRVPSAALSRLSVSTAVLLIAIIFCVTSSLNPLI